MGGARHAAARIRWSIGLVLVGLAAAGCAATTSKPAGDENTRCVVSIEPMMKMVTFAPASGLDGGVTSLFFKEMPAVAPGDLIRLDNSAGQGGPSLEKLEARSESCADVAQTAADHHKGH